MPTTTGRPSPRSPTAAGPRKPANSWRRRLTPAPTASKCPPPQPAHPPSSAAHRGQIAVRPGSEPQEGHKRRARHWTHRRAGDRRSASTNARPPDRSTACSDRLIVVPITPAPGGSSRRSTTSTRPHSRPGSRRVSCGALARTSVVGTSPHRIRENRSTVDLRHSTVAASTVGVARSLRPRLPSPTTTARPSPAIGQSAASLVATTTSPGTVAASDQTLVTSALPRPDEATRTRPGNRVPKPSASNRTSASDGAITSADPPAVTTPATASPILVSQGPGPSQ